MDRSEVCSPSFWWESAKSAFERPEAALGAGSPTGLGVLARSLLSAGHEVRVDPDPGGPA